MADDNREDLKVVAHLADGSLIKGYLLEAESFDPLSATPLPGLFLQPRKYSWDAGSLGEQDTG